MSDEDSREGASKLRGMWAMAKAIAEAHAPDYGCEDAARDLDRLSKNRLQKERRLPLMTHLGHCAHCLKKANELMEEMQRRMK